MSDKKQNAKTVQKAREPDADKKTMVEVEALITPLITEKAKVAKGGRVAMDQATAELKAKAGELTIIRVIG